LEEAATKATLWHIDQAIEEGVDISFDVIGSTSSIASPNPLIREFWKSRNVALAWINHLSKEDLIAKLRTIKFRNQIKQVYNSGRLKLGMIHTKVDPYWMDRFKILKCKIKAYEGQTLGQIARNQNSEPLDTIFNLLAEDPDTIWIQFVDDRAFATALTIIIKHPLAMPCTDMVIFPLTPDSIPDFLGQAQPPPIAYGIFADYIGTWVRETSTLRLEEAVRKATALPAQRFGLTGRGIISPNAYADLVVFDFEKIRMKGDYLTPSQVPAGINYVLVNGAIVYDQGNYTGKRPGKVLRHSKL
jgi:N-acyl-D-amino-acid deacylase